MRKNRGFVIAVLFIFSINILLTGFTKWNEKVNLIKTINNKVNGTIVEYGITAEFLWDKDPESLCNNILEGLDYYTNWDKKIVKNPESYYIEFKKNNVNGYIESVKYEKHNIIKVNVIKRDDKNELERMKATLKNAIPVNNIKCYEYLKAQIPYESVENANKDVLQILKRFSVIDTNTVNIENGYSTTAYTGLYSNKIYNSGRCIDFNYAVCKYSSGVYLIIGTPEITVTY